MKKIYFIFLSLMLFACSASVEETGGEMKEFNTDSAPTVDSLATNGLSNQLRDSLSDYFSMEIINQIDQYLVSYHNVTTTSEFETNYHDGMALFDSMYSDFEFPNTDYLREISKNMEYWSPAEIINELDVFNDRLGPIHISCVAECTDLDFFFDLNNLQEKAITTSGSGDDDFMELVISMEGYYGYAAYPGFKNWFTPTWDLGGRSNIGDGTLLNCILLCQEFEQTYPNLFAKEIIKIREILSDALIYETIYSYSQRMILEEYDKILKLDFFSGKEKEEIEKHYKEIEQGKESLQFECETNDCMYG